MAGKMYFSEEEKRITLTHKQIKKDLLGDSYYQLAAGISVFIISLTILCFSMGAAVNEINKFDATLASYYNTILMIIGELVFVALFVISTVLLVSVIKRIYIASRNSFEVVCDEVEYITTEDEVRYSFNKYRSRHYVTIDILHFKTYGKYKLKTHPTEIAGGDKFYLVISQDGGKIYNIYSQKTYYYRK